MPDYTGLTSPSTTLHKDIQFIVVPNPAVPAPPVTPISAAAPSGIAATAPPKGVNWPAYDGGYWQTTVVNGVSKLIFISPFSTAHRL